MRTLLCVRVGHASFQIVEIQIRWMDGSVVYDYILILKLESKSRVSRGRALKILFKILVISLFREKDHEEGITLLGGKWMEGGISRIDDSL